MRTRVFSGVLTALSLLIAVLAASGASVGAQETAAPMVDAVFVIGDGSGGIYIVDQRGLVDARDGLAHHGGSPPLASGETVVAIAALGDATGYWLFTSTGRIHAYGAAEHHGDLAQLQLAAPIIAAAARPDGSGYWMVGEDGGIFAFGNARFHGSVPELLPGVPLAAPVIGIAQSASGAGYLLVAADGGIFAFGDAEFHGSIPGVLPGVQLAAPVVGVVPQTGGYVMVAGDGGVFNFGSSTFYGSLGNIELDPISAIAVPPGDLGYTLIDEFGVPYPFGFEVMLNWGFRVFEGGGEGPIGTNVHIPYEQPWGTPSLVFYEFLGPDDRRWDMNVRAQIPGRSSFVSLLTSKYGNVHGFVIPEWFSSYGPIDELVFHADEMRAFRARIAPVWYTRFIDDGDIYAVSNESIWRVGEEGVDTVVELTMNTPKDVISIFYPDDGSAPVEIVSGHEFAPSVGGSRVVSGSGVVIVRSSVGYTIGATRL